MLYYLLGEYLSMTRACSKIELHIVFNFATFEYKVYMNKSCYLIIYIHVFHLPIAVLKKGHYILIFMIDTFLLLFFQSVITLTRNKFMVTHHHLPTFNYIHIYDNLVSFLSPSLFSIYHRHHFHN